MSFSESDFIAWCTAGSAGRSTAAGATGSTTDAAARSPGGRLTLGPGDDAAVLADGSVLTVDTVVEGTHFVSGTAPALIAHKALASAVSDVCAMGARAALVLVSAQLPPGVDGRALALAVTVLGHLPAGAQAWTRSGARPGDRLWVSGPLGGAGTGRHLAVRPRADVVAALRAAAVPVHAAMDLSDGLGLDLVRLCTASGLGALVEAERLPVHADVTAGRDAVSAVLGDGEDFELLLCLPPEVVPPVDLDPALVEIGRMVPGDGPRLQRDGREQAWPGGGFEHGF